MSSTPTVWMYPPGRPNRRQEVPRGQQIKYMREGWVKCSPPKPALSGMEDALANALETSVATETQSQDVAAEPAEQPKRGRGRPAGSTKKAAEE